MRYSDNPGEQDAGDVPAGNVEQPSPPEAAPPSSSDLQQQQQPNGSSSSSSNNNINNDDHSSNNNQIASLVDEPSSSSSWMSSSSACVKKTMSLKFILTGISLLWAALVLAIILAINVDAVRDVILLEAHLLSSDVLTTAASRIRRKVQNVDMVIKSLRSATTSAPMGPFAPTAATAATSNESLSVAVSTNLWQTTLTEAGLVVDRNHHVLPVDFVVRFSAAAASVAIARSQDMVQTRMYTISNASGGGNGGFFDPAAPSSQTNGGTFVVDVPTSDSSSNNIYTAVNASTLLAVGGAAGASGELLQDERTLVYSELWNRSVEEESFSSSSTSWFDRDLVYHVPALDKPDLALRLVSIVHSSTTTMVVDALISATLCLRNLGADLLSMLRSPHSVAFIVDRYDRVVWSSLGPVYEVVDSTASKDAILAANPNRSCWRFDEDKSNEHNPRQWACMYDVATHPGYRLLSEHDVFRRGQELAHQTRSSSSTTSNNNKNFSWTFQLGAAWGVSSASRSSTLPEWSGLVTNLDDGGGNLVLYAFLSVSDFVRDAKQAQLQTIIVFCLVTTFFLGVGYWYLSRITRVLEKLATAMMEDPWNPKTTEEDLRRDEFDASEETNSNVDGAGGGGDHNTSPEENPTTAENNDDNSNDSERDIRFIDQMGMCWRSCKKYMTTFSELEELKNEFRSFRHLVADLRGFMDTAVFPKLRRQRTSLGGSSRSSEAFLGGEGSSMILAESPESPESPGPPLTTSPSSSSPTATSSSAVVTAAAAAATTTTTTVAAGATAATTTPDTTQPAAAATVANTTTPEVTPTVTPKNKKTVRFAANPVHSNEDWVVDPQTSLSSTMAMPPPGSPIVLVSPSSASTSTSSFVINTTTTTSSSSPATTPSSQSATTTTTSYITPEQYNAALYAMMQQQQQQQQQTQFVASQQQHLSSSDDTTYDESNNSNDSNGGGGGNATATAPSNYMIYAPPSSPSAAAAAAASYYATSSSSSSYQHPSSFRPAEPLPPPPPRMAPVKRGFCVAAFINFYGLHNSLCESAQMIARTKIVVTAMTSLLRSTGAALVEYRGDHFICCVRIRSNGRSKLVTRFVQGLMTMSKQVGEEQQQREHNAGVENHISLSAGVACGNCRVLTMMNPPQGCNSRRVTYLGQNFSDAQILERFVRHHPSVARAPRRRLKDAPIVLSPMREQQIESAVAAAAVAAADDDNSSSGNNNEDGTTFPAAPPPGAAAAMMANNCSIELTHAIAWRLTDLYLLNQPEYDIIPPMVENDPTRDGVNRFSPAVNNAVRLLSVAEKKTVLSMHAKQPKSS